MTSLRVQNYSQNPRVAEGTLGVLCKTRPSLQLLQDTWHEHCGRRCPFNFIFVKISREM